MLASLTISGASTGVSVVVPTAPGSVGVSQPAEVAVLRGQVLEITLDGGGATYEGTATIEVEME